MNIDFPKAMPYYFYYWIIGVAFLYEPLIKTDNYITSGHISQGAELYKLPTSPALSLATRKQRRDEKLIN